MQTEGDVVYLSNTAQGGVVYGQYTTAKGCSYAQRNMECLYTALNCGILAIYHKPPEVPYCYYKLVTNVIRAVKIHVLSYPWCTTAFNQSAFRARTLM